MKEANKRIGNRFITTTLNRAGETEIRLSMPVHLHNIPSLNPPN